MPFKKFILIILIVLIISLNVSCEKPEKVTPSIKSMFSPDGQIAETLIHLIDSSKRSIDVAMYCFTRRDLAWALVRAKNRGVKVRVILDESNSHSKYSKFRFFENKGINVKLHEITMHNKFAIIDGKILITGSYNWTASAEERNRENILIIKNAPDLTDKYQQEFDKLWESSIYAEEEEKEKNE